MAESGRHSDVLIVGAGSAGSIVASLLSADNSRIVTVVESGVGLVDPELRRQCAEGHRLPIGAASPLVRRYQTQLTENPARSATLIRGAIVGGSGAVNGGYFCRALPRDFDRLGLPGWAWRDVLGHFRAIETDLDFSGPLHGDCGPIPVQRSSQTVGSAELFAAAARRVGFSWIADLNGVSAGPAAPAGFGSVPLNIVNGVRTGPGTAYLLPVLDRSNLTLLTETTALRVNIVAGRAVGVDAIGPGGVVTLTADRIVLSAGAIESAHLLMLSGIGDEAMLGNFGIDVVAALPVGLNCADHPEWVLPVDWPAALDRPVLELVAHTADNIELRPYTKSFAAMIGSGEQERYRPNIGVALMRPTGRSRITLTSTDPRQAPLIEHRYDSEPADIDMLRSGVGVVREMIAGTAELGTPAWSTSQHLCGSAPMGVAGDERAVLDETCRVRGVEGLWVVDGSVLPQIPSRGPHATIAMVGHRAAEFI